MQVRQETVKVRGGQDQVLTIRETQFGPVVTSLASDVRPGEEVALKRIPLCETDVETVEAALAMFRARDTAEFDAALAGWRFPSANAVFGDRNGNIGYRTAGAFPYRSLLAPDGGNAAHDGSSSRFDWIGMVPHSLAPHVMNPSRGYLATANHRPIASFYPIPIFSGTGSGGDTVRSRRLAEILEQDTLFTPDEVLAVHYDEVNSARRDIVRWGRWIRQSGARTIPEEMRRALDYLEDWYGAGAKSDRSIRGTELAELLPLNFRSSNTELALTYGGGEPGLCYFLKSLERRFAADPNASLTAAESGFVQDSLVSAWKTAVQSYGADSSRWQSGAAESLRSRKLGYFESLDGFPSLDPAFDLSVPGLSCVDGGTIQSQLSESYTQWVPLHDVDKARSLLPVGMSEKPGSLFRLSTYTAWQEGELHAAPLRREALEPYIIQRTSLTAGGWR